MDPVLQNYGFLLSAQVNLLFFLTTLWTLQDKLSSLNADVTALKNTRWVFALVGSVLAFGGRMKSIWEGFWVEKKSKMSVLSG